MLVDDDVIIEAHIETDEPALRVGQIVAVRLIEKQANRFASAFLMPSTTYPHEVRHPSLAMFTSLNERWE